MKHTVLILYFCLSQNQSCSLNLNVVDSDEKLLPKEKTYAKRNKWNKWTSKSYLHMYM